MQIHKESFWEQAGNAIVLLLVGPLIGISWFVKWLLRNRTKWLIDQLPHRAIARKKRDREIKALEEKLGLKKRNKNSIYYDPLYYKHAPCSEYYERYNDDSFWGPNTYAAKRQRYLEELRSKVKEGWKDPEILVNVDFKFNTGFVSCYTLYIAVKRNSCFDYGQRPLGASKFYPGLHLDECGNQLDYKAIWRSKAICDYRIFDPVSLKERKEVVEFLKELQQSTKKNVH